MFKVSRRKFVTLNSIGLSMLFTGLKLRKSYYLKKNKAVLIPANSQLFLPENVKSGDYVHFSVQPSSLKGLIPVIKYEGIPILSDKEDLYLNSLSIIKLVYKNKSIGWKFS